ncbi:MAG: HIT domain-containing protein [Chloroflexi bacterium]|nr:HIT domain-containing protein [Chloroflexota bacterium]
MKDCVFCNILSGDLPAHFVYEDDLVVAFLSLEQPNPYKVLVIPRTHVAMIYDLNDEQAAAIFQATVKIARGVRAASNCDGMNLVQSNGKAGQQDVFHFHLHIVPRFVNDDIVLDWDNTPVSQERLSQISREIREELDKTKPV